MANCKLLLPKLLRWEGGYVNDPDDHGGETNMGVTISVFNLARKQKIITTENLKDLTQDDVFKILKHYYWDKCKGDYIFSQSCAELFVDWYYNSGTYAIQNVQMILGVKVDGIFGKHSLSAFNDYNPEILFDEIKKKRSEFVYKIVQNNSTQRKFLKGWINRINSFTFK